MGYRPEYRLKKDHLGLEPGRQIGERGPISSRRVGDARVPSSTVVKWRSHRRPVDDMEEDGEGKNGASWSTKDQLFSIFRRKSASQFHSEHYTSEWLA